MLERLFLILFLLSFCSSVSGLENCKWNNQKGVPCTTISKTPNTSSYNSQGVNKKIFTRQKIIESGATTAIDVLKKVSGLDYYQTGQKGQQAAIFMRGSESNHTLVMLNGIAINDQSATNGLHDFGQDFIQTVQQVEVYKGPQGSSVGANAMAGFINMYSTQPQENAANRFRVEAGNYGLFNVGIAAGTEFNSDVQGRFSLNQLTSDGFVENKTLNKDDTNDINELSFRGLLDVEFNNEVTSQFVLHYFDIDNGYDAFSLDQDRTTLSDEPGEDKQETLALGVNTTYTGFENTDLTVMLSHSD